MVARSGLADFHLMGGEEVAALMPFSNGRICAALKWAGESTPCCQRTVRSCDYQLTANAALSVSFSMSM